MLLLSDRYLIHEGRLYFNKRTSFKSAEWQQVDKYIKETSLGDLFSFSTSPTIDCLGYRLESVLNKSDIWTMEDLLLYSVNDLLNLKSLGAEYVFRIVAKLESLKDDSVNA